LIKSNISKLPQKTTWEWGTVDKLLHSHELHMMQILIEMVIIYAEETNNCIALRKYWICGASVQWALQR
jgi:hypothetical protein